MTSCGFSMVDVQNMLMIIQTCQKRGAFYAEEMTGIGNLYDKLKKAHDAHTSKMNESECGNESECENGVCPVNQDDVGKVGT